ncbi:hypothetical protein BD309DRAFT_949490 [Dichomitus squalens]|uniref:Complex 1 LYR protein n=1 Tax=Dichomitus squalens TaxID=114155 RepID=A0A4Q9P4A4_9APHY|nr:uncharacterized protein DICSQDRAFT_145915 [Dichomitus squalens LYAD-421 SS1]EJF62927.1 hypothetical protein DICSQDRAFT_145915 [Dichomitus squalens LYAD-421 SS1]TBU32070.1 hypothetical protein BD311DRAFT_862901 [Dichomitus squalens]TBU48445.1 hypothetical protein BD309DRAFT_949490 [Dichomitus squalens]TBU58793.1 hypothetical protein BD310DRAFT_878449 [Dichomitus squalens]
MAAQHLSAYRAIVREVNRASINARATRPKVVSQCIRAIFESSREDKDTSRFYHDMRNAATFMRSQRIHKELLERYNPMHGLSQEDRIKKTANRVGLDMPIGGSGPKDEDY